MPSASSAPFYVGSFSWNFSLGVSMLVVPLYAHDLGMSGTQIGALLGVPVVAQILFSLGAGVLTDRVGGRAMVLFSFASMATAGVVYTFAESFLPILLGQFLLVISRAVYWPSSQTIASHLPGAPGLHLGRLSAIANFGQVSGTMAAGLLLAQWSFTTAFLTLAGMALLALALCAASPLGGRGDTGSQGSILDQVGTLLRRRSVYFAIICAYMAAVPTTLSHSFYPILLVEFGFPSDSVGGLVVLRAAGAIAVSLFLVRYIRARGRLALPLTAMLASAAGIGLIPLSSHGAAVAAFLLSAGAGSGVMFIYYQIVMSEFSNTQNRGTALALGGLGYGLSHLTTPLVMGFLSDTVGIANAFHLLGAFALLITVAFLPLQRWAVAVPDTAVGREA